MLVQRDLYKKDIPLIEKGNVGISSELKQLCPFIDSSRLLRSRGRLGKSILGYDSKHPIILNAKHSGTKFYLEHVHKKNHHEVVEYFKEYCAKTVLDNRDKELPSSNKTLLCPMSKAKC